MDEKYLKSIYDWIGQADATFPFDVTYDQFKVKMQDSTYVQKMHGWIGSMDPTFANEVPIDSFDKKLKGLAPVVQPVALKKKLVSPSGSTLLASQKTATEPEEQDYFTGAFGDVLRGLDNIVPIGIGDFVDDMARSVASGYRQGTSAEEADRLLLQGTKATPEQIQKFINANKNAQMLGPSAEMQDYQKIYENEGKGFWGVVKGLANNPSIIPEVLTSSITAMATNTDALTAGAAGVGTGAAYGAGTGAVAGGIGAIPGAAAGAIASLPYAFGLASSVVEMGSTFGELLQEELGGKEMTKDNVKAILENPEKLNSIRNRAIARGAIIGTVDAFTGKLASGVGAKIIRKSAAKSATGAVTRGAATRAVLAGAAVEGAGGSLGEATARGAIGQEMDVSEIALEGIAELPGGIRSTIQARLAKPSYKVNGEKVSAEQVDELINTMSPADLAKTKIDIKNDYQGREFKIQDKIVTSAIKEQVKQGNPDLNEPSLNAITELEKELKKLEGNTTQTGKDKAAAIRGQIKNIQENQIQEEAKVETIEAEAPEITVKRADRIAEIETTLSPESTVVIEDAERTKLQTELETLKTEQDAIQKQATDESLLRTGEPKMGLQQVGEGNKGLEVAATGTQETITPQGTQEVVATEVTPTEPSDVGTFKINGDNATESEFFQAYRKQNEISSNGDYNPNPDKIEYSGNDNNIIQALENYERDNKTYEKDGSLGNRYMKWAISRAFGNVPFRKFASAFRKHIDNTFKAENQELNGMTFRELAGYIITDRNYDVTDEQFRKFAESVGITIPERTEIVTITQPTVSSKTQPTTQTQQNAGTTTTQTTTSTAGPIAGNRLFNKPLTKAKEVANRYYQRVFGTERPKFAGTRKLDEVRAKRISDAYIAMKDDPTNPEVKAAYEALAKETLDQYKDFLDSGFNVEINNEEPYANSQEMIDDLRNNNRIKIFSTESGFGSNPITEEQRQRNPLLQDSGFKDVNGNTLLVNDVFRAIHDFYGHAELGNSFGPKGEENAWNIHARMFSPLARRAMTTETRGQNSYVNFSGVNEKIEQLREDARRLREQGDEAGAQLIVEQIYQEGLFAEQKIGLLPEEFSQFDEDDSGDVTMRPEGLQERDTQAEPVVTEVVVEEEVFEPITASDVKTPAFNRENALFYEEDERETDSGRTSTYLSSVTVEATNTDEEPLGTITKITDEDKIFYFTAEDVDGNEINLDGFETLGEAKKAIADSYNKVQKKEFDKAAKKKAKDKAKAEAKKTKAKAKAETTTVTEVEEDVAGTLDELLELDPNDETTLKKVSSALGQALKDIEKFERENLGVNIALPVMKAIIQAVKVLVDAGVALQEAIKKVAKDNNVNSRDVINGINAVSQIAPIQEAYDALMVKADELIARQKGRNIAEPKIVSNLDTLIRNSEVYKNANDAQKKIMEREARNKMGVAPKKAVSIGRVLGSLKDITNISRAEKMLVIKRIRDLTRDAAKDLAKEIREMASGGKITAVQAANIVARFGKVNMLNEISVSNFVDYMAKVFANAEYANKIDVAKSRLKAAKKNIATKIGIADGLVGPLQRLFSINPTLIPDQYLERYLELVDMFSARQAVLNLEEKSVVTKDVNDILNEIDNEQSKADELADRFNNSKNKVFKGDELDYAASVKKMLDEKEIDDKEAETMRKYKEDIAPQVEETELTEEEAQQERDELIAVVKSSQVDGTELPSKDERDLAKEIARLIKTDALKGLTNTELKNLLKVIDNINNNYLPHYAQLMAEKMNAINNGKTLTNSIKSAKVAKFSGLYARAKSLITKKGAIVELIRRNPLFNIDQLFGDFKTKDIFNSVLNKAAEGEAKFSAELKKIQNILEKAEEKVAKSFKLDSNKTLMSKFKMMTYMIQLEYESNKGNKEVNPASDYLKATIKHIDAGKAQFGERDAEMLQDILDKYTDADGNIDNEKLYNSFNQAEKDAIKDIRGVNESLREKAEYTAAIIRGDRINPLNNYVHLNVLHEHQPNDLTAGSAFITEYNDSMRPSTKAKSLIARTGKVSPLNFDVFASAQRGAKFVLMDYNLTEPIRTARKTINQAIANLEDEGRIPKEKRDIINAINSAFEEAIENLLTNTYVSTSIADDVIDYINKQGYRAILAGTGRFASELMSNIGFALITDPNAFVTGTKYKGIIMSTDAPLVMENVNSKQTNRIFPTDTLSGKLIDTSILKQASGIKGGKAKNIIANKIQQIYNLTGKKYANVVELTADALISTPDKIIMRPMWFGSFANEFKKVSGKDVDFDKIAANDEKYMADNKEAIEQAKTIADERSVMTGATDNAFMGILKGTTKPNQSATLRAFNNFNNFMTRFLIFEYVTARTGIMAAMGNGSLTKKQGVALLGGVTTRMVVYTLLTQILGTGLMGLFFDDEEEETEKSFMQKLGQSFASAFTSLTFGRDFGNATKMMVNYGLERANENYLDFLREGEYDPYKDAIQYSIVPPERKGKQRDLSDFLLNMGGAFGPSLKTADFIVRKALEPEKKEAEAIVRREKELNIRIPLEVLGNAGLVPLYKDVRKAVMKDIYKDLEKAENDVDKKSKEKPGGMNKEDLKRYKPELYEKYYGKGSPRYELEKRKADIKREKEKMLRKMKDEFYDYQPPARKTTKRSTSRPQSNITTRRTFNRTFSRGMGEGKN